MTQDFAKKKRARSAPPESAPAARPAWMWFGSGFFAGAFLMFIGGLWFLSYDPSAPAETATPRPEPQARTEEAGSEEMQWDFYEIFPKSEVPVVEEYNAEGEKVQTDQFAWILQVGSFRDPNDADELRASLLLMGLDVTTTPIDVDGQKWHRVIVGPFNSQLERNRAQDKLAQAEIQSMPYRIKR